MSVTISISLPDSLYVKLESKRPDNINRSEYYQKILDAGLKNKKVIKN